MLAAPALAIGLGTQSVAAADPVDTVDCHSNVSVFLSEAPAGDLWLYHHLDPENGTFNWDQKQQIGNGWTGRTIAGPNGYVYSITDNATGDLRRLHWTGSAWDTYDAAGTQYQVIGQWWNGWTSPQFRNRVAVDANGDFYTDESDGNLYWQHYDEASKTWTRRLVDTGWGGYDHIVAAGPGILYARTPSGDLFRYVYDAGSQRWLQKKKPSGQGWNMFTQIFSPGGDILYGRGTSDAKLLWYRYQMNADKWITANDGTGKVVGYGWNTELDVTADPGACKLSTALTPARPAVTAQPHASNTLLRSSNGYLQWAYTNANGRPTYAEIRDITSVTRSNFAAVPGTTLVTGPPALGENADGRIQELAQGTNNAEFYSNTQSTPGNAWAGDTTLGGFMVSPPTLARSSDSTLTAFAVDAQGQLWTRQQATKNGPLLPWLPQPSKNITANQLTVAASGNNLRVVALHTDGVFRTATVTQGMVGAWTDISGLAGTGTASAVVMPDSTLQVFARGTDNQIYTKRETSTGFPGAWTVIPGITAAGSPSATLGPDGALHVGVRASDNYIYTTGQQAPGAAAYSAWQEITDKTTLTSTDPTLVAMPDASTWVVAFRSDLDVPKLRRNQPAAPAAATPRSQSTAQAPRSTFVDVPLNAPTN
ncbi:tachylectin-related carbohydrate-binding protein [Solihabitans fulvus]|uniref:tachylectin-related carbohydrate-binding protein n=1 Tax=Solihabitans fulvus TaxID=1892852 RepID=UPI001661B07C|nr:tachylectin-related carbohydrate-binding protein [Solihabitans fulvus]